MEVYYSYNESEKQVLRMWNGLHWYKIMPNGGLRYLKWWNLGFYYQSQFNFTINKNHNGVKDSFSALRMWTVQISSRRLDISHGGFIVFFKTSTDILEIYGFHLNIHSEYLTQSRIAIHRMMSQEDQSSY